MKSGIATEYIKGSIRPQDDLFRHVNGAWLDEAQIPADRSSDGAFYWLRELSEKQVRTIIEDLSQTDAAPGSVAQKIGDLYRSFMDEAAIESAGIEPIRSDLSRALTISSLDEFITVMGDLESRGGAGLFYSFITTDNKESTKNIAYLGQSGLSLPDEAYYREDDYAEIRSAFLGHIEKMFSLAGLDDGALHAARVLELETQIATHHWDQVKDRDATLTYNKFTHSDLQELMPAHFWSTWMAASKVPAKVLDEVILRQPSFFAGLGKMLTEFDCAKWSSWLTWQVLSGSSPYLNAALVHENFAFFGTTLSGTPELKARWKRGVALVEGGLGEAVGQIFVERHFPPAAKERMVGLVAHLIEAYRIDIEALDWMSEPTKQKAYEKLNKFTPKIGYPDKWRDYSSLQISPTDLIANLNAIAQFQAAYEYAKIGSPVDRSEWFMFPQTVNAYYNPGMNEIVFPAAILQPPFFDLEADDAANYGGIGAVIGHEIGHGFDDQGAKYDGDGNLEDWWSAEDLAKFQDRAALLIKQYDALAPEETPETHVNGALTIGENIGDLGGLTIAYKAYQLSLGGKQAPMIDGLTGYQRLFYGWAQVWRGKVRPEEMKRRIATDPHSPSEFRCNQIVRNLNEFYEAFDLKPTDALYLAPEERVRIW
jgi:putative endopeptidase